MEMEIDPYIVLCTQATYLLSDGQAQHARGARDDGDLRQGGSIDYG